MFIRGRNFWSGAGAGADTFFCLAPGQKLKFQLTKTKLEQTTIYIIKDINKQESKQTINQPISKTKSNLPLRTQTNFDSSDDLVGTTIRFTTDKKILNTSKKNENEKL